MHPTRLAAEVARLQDLPRLFEISSKVHRTNYAQFIPEEHLDGFLEHYEENRSNLERFVTFTTEKMHNPLYRIFKATQLDGAIVGYLSIQEGAQPSEIRSVFVDPAHQHKGIGSLLMDRAIKEVGHQPIELFVISGNTGAMALYEKYGFRVTGVADKVFFGASLLRMERQPVQ